MGVPSDGKTTKETSHIYNIIVWLTSQAKLKTQMLKLKVKTQISKVLNFAF